MTILKDKENSLGSLAGKKSRNRAEKADIIASGPSFAGLVLSLLTSGPDREKASAGAPLAHLDYAAELQMKDAALDLFWRHHRLPGRPESVTASPQPRHYRTTSKRRAFLRGGTLFLGFGDKSEEQGRPFVASPLEPAAHARIYQFLQQKLSEPAFRLAAQHLNYLIIRGSYAEQAVIFNIDLLNGPLIRKFKLLAGHLQKLPEPVAAAYTYHDPSRSDYYLESRPPAEGLRFKKLFGRDQLMVGYDGYRYLFHPTSFSQVNESMVAILLQKARELLAPSPGQHLLDLYCGYGLFSHYLAPHYRQVVGVDAEGPSIKAAAANSRLNPGSGRTRFLARRITGGLLAENLPAASGPEAVILDPPRQGPQSGVIDAVCLRRPERALHVFCGMDQIPASLREWQDGGYRVERIVPLDMFAGSANLEVLILLAPAVSDSQKPVGEKPKTPRSRLSQKGRSAA